MPQGLRKLLRRRAPYGTESHGRKLHARRGFSTHVCVLRPQSAGALTLVVSGAWSAFASWKHRQGFAHLLSILVIIWGLVLVMGIVLPRVGYAGQHAIWFCPEPK